MKQDKDRARISKIVVAIDISDYSKLVMEKAFVIANSFDSDVYAVSVVKMPVLAAEEGDFLMSEVKREEKELLDHHKLLIDKYFTGSTLLVESQILHGDPANKICDFAASVSADIIIIGSKGLSGIQRLFLGSVSQSVIKNAPCSVFVVRDKEFKR